jgi:putative ABC transport system permease protein
VESLRTFLAKAFGIFRRARFEQELESEIQDHMTNLELRFVQQGMTIEDARHAARSAFGGIDRLKEANRDQYSFAFVDHVCRDLKFAFRSLRKNPGFTVVAVVTLALGIGANTAIFSVLNGVLLRPLPYEHDANLVLVRQELPLAGIPRLNFSVHDIEDYRNQNSTFASIVEYHEMSFVLLGGEEAQRVQTGVVSWNFFDLLGVKPFLGRTFRSDDEQHGAEAVLVLSYEYWQRGFGGDPAIIGRQFQMNDRVHVVIGVLPPVPQFPQENDVYMPTSACPFRSADTFIANRDSRMMGVVGRLKSGVSLQNAQADLNVIANRLQERYPESYTKSGGYRAAVVSLKDQITRNIRPTLWVLLSTAGFVLLIVCASLANLMLARLLRRDREISVRVALGATRMQLIREFLTESTVLAFVGGLLGLGVAFSTLDLLVAFAAKFTTRAQEIHIDGRVLLFTAVVSIFTGLVFGCIPAFTSRRNVADSLRSDSRRASSPSRHQRLRNVLIVVEVAIAFILLVGAGLMVRSLMKLQEVDLGIRAENVLSARVDLNFSKYHDNETIRRFYRDLLERLRAIPTVTAAGAGSTFPLSDQPQRITGIRFKDRVIEDASASPQLNGLAASPGYFQALGIPLLEGRDFSDADRSGMPPVIIVNSSMAQHYWRTESSLGGQISIDNGTTWATIIGVVADSRKSLDAEVEDSFYVPLDQVPVARTILVRTTGDPAKIGQLVRGAVHSVDPEQPVDSLRTLEEVRSDSISSPRLTMALLSLFAGLALLITAAGIGGVIGFFVNQRRHEIGIRMALGAEHGSVLWLVLREGMILISLGILFGFAGAFGLGRLMGGLLFRIRATDPATFIGVTFVVVVVAACACLVPAYRATTIDPTTALRSD